MKKQGVLRIPTTLLVVVAFIVIVAGTFLAITQQATANEPKDITAVSSSVGSAITYQGELIKDGIPYTGPCDMKFQLFDAASGGNTTSSELAQSVPISEGIFTVNLDFGAYGFSEDAQFLDIAVKCVGDSDYTNMGSRVALTAVPYALTLRPGAVISGTSPFPLSVRTSSTGLNSTGIFGYASANTNTDKYGVWGEINASSGAGVMGQAGTVNIMPGLKSGVIGRSDSGYGVSGVSGQAHGVWGTTDSSHDYYAGVYGQALNSAANGVYGRSFSTTGSGVRGHIEANSGTNYGVYGSTNSPDGYGVYSEGNAHIEGDLTWKPITGYVTLPAAAFHPATNTISFNNAGTELVPLDVGYSAFLTEVQLPHNATVTKFTFYWRDNSIANSSAYLYKIDLAGSETSMAEVFSDGNANVADSSATDVINSPVIDNSTSGYYVWLSFTPPSTNLTAYGVTIEYTINQPY